MRVRLLVADPQPVVRAGLFSFFNGSDVQIVDDAQTCEQTVSKTLGADPDVLMLEADFPDGTGFDAVQKLREEKYRGKVVFFEATGRQTYLARAFSAGADAYLLKSSPRADIIACLEGLTRPAGQDESTMDYSGELRRVSALMRRHPVDALSPLTEREAQVLRHVALGLSNKEIALSLSLSVDTVKEHVQNILRKLEVNDRTQAAVWAVRNKQIP